MAKAAGGTATKGDVFSLERIRDLISLMKEHELSEVDLKQADQQIRLVRGGQVAAGPAVTAAPIAAVAPVVPATASLAPTATADGPHITTIKSPMVGTFYSKPNPNAEDFVKVGSKITPETVLCTVEAMKVFNEIPAEIGGTIVEILAKNEDAVDFGRPLFKVDTRG
ncbi:MAG: acetyl-CoA carboxylase biotin carboxyl carrier protein [Pirellulaceae bacterium]